MEQQRSSNSNLIEHSVQLEKETTQKKKTMKEITTLQNIKDIILQRKSAQTQKITQIDSQTKIYPSSMIVKNDNGTINEQETQKDQIQKTDLLQTFKLKSVAQRMLRFVKSRQYDKLGQFHFDLINDLGNRNYSLTQISSLYRRLRQIPILKYYFEQIPVFSPSNKLKIFWDLLQLICIILAIFFIAIQLGTQLETEQLINHNLNLLIKLIIVLDIIIQFNSGYYERGNLIMDRFKVTENYLNTDFLSDFLLVFLYIISEYTLKILMIFFILKVNKIKTIIMTIRDAIQIDFKILNYLELIQLMLFILFVGHIFACIWIFEAKNSISTNNWLKQRGILYDSWQVQYLNALYFSIVTMCTVGYGDVYPTNNEEIMLLIINMLIACGVFAHAINIIGSIYMDITQEKTKMRNKLFGISKYMMDKGITSDLQYRVKQYLEYYFKEQSSINDEVNKSINLLSIDLKKQLILEANKVVLKDSPIFKNNFSPRLLQRCVDIISETNLPPNQQIKTVIDDEIFIHFLEKGKIDYVYGSGKLQVENNTGKKVLREVKLGEPIGVYEFFTGQSINQTLISKEFCRMLTIKRSEFLEILREYPEDQEIFQVIKELLLHQNDYTRVGVNCQSCGSRYHDLYECNLIHLVLDPYKVIRRQNLVNERQQRLSFLRNRKKKVNAIKSYQKVQDLAQDIQYNYDSYLFEQSWMISDAGSSIEDEDYSENDSQKGELDQYFEPDEPLQLNRKNQAQKKSQILKIHKKLSLLQQPSSKSPNLKLSDSSSSTSSVSASQNSKRSSKVKKRDDNYEHDKMDEEIFNLVEIQSVGSTRKRTATEQYEQKQKQIIWSPRIEHEQQQQVQNQQTLQEKKKALERKRSSRIRDTFKKTSVFIQEDSPGLRAQITSEKTIGSKINQMRKYSTSQRTIEGRKLSEQYPDLRKLPTIREDTKRKRQTNYLQQLVGGSPKADARTNLKFCNCNCHHSNNPIHVSQKSIGPPAKRDEEPTNTSLAQKMKTLNNYDNLSSSEIIEEAQLMGKIPDMDRMKIFENYFVQHNYTYVLEKFKKYQQKRIASNLNLRSFILNLQSLKRKKRINSFKLGSSISFKKSNPSDVEENLPPDNLSFNRRLLKDQSQKNHRSQPKISLKVTQNQSQDYADSPIVKRIVGNFIKTTNSQQNNNALPHSLNSLDEESSESNLQSFSKFKLLQNAKINDTNNEM